MHRANNIDAYNKELPCVLDPDADSTPCNHNGLVIPYTLISDDKCNGNKDAFLSPVHLRCTPSEDLGKEIGKALGYLVAAALISVLLIAFVFTFSKDARETAIALFGTDGPIGTFLLRFNCFRSAEGAYIYSQLNDQTDALYEEDSEEDDDNELGVFLIQCGGEQSKQLYQALSYRISQIKQKEEK